MMEQPRPLNSPAVAPPGFPANSQAEPLLEPSSERLIGDCWRVVGKHLSAREVVRLSHVDRYLWQLFSRTQKLLNILIERYYGADEESQKRWRNALENNTWSVNRGRFALWQKTHLHDKDIQEWVNSDPLRQQALFRYLSSDSGIVVRRLSSGRIFADRSIVSITALTDNRLATGSYYGTIKIWDLRKKTGQQCIARLAGHTDSVYSLRVQDNGILISSSGDSTLRTWDLTRSAGDECIMTLPVGYGILAMAVLSDDRLATIARTNRLTIWDLSCPPEQALVGSVKTEACILCLDALSNGQVVCGCTDNTLQILDPYGLAVMPDPVAILKGHKAFARCVLTLPDGKIASGAYDKTVKIWNPDLPPERRCISTLEHSSSVHSLALLSDGRLLAGVDSDYMVIWDLTRPEPEYAIRLQQPGFLIQSAVYLNGQVISHSFHHLRTWELSEQIDSTKSLPDGSQPQDLITCTATDSLTSRTPSKARKRKADGELVDNSAP